MSDRLSRPRTLILGAAVLLVSLGLVIGGWYVSLTDFQFTLDKSCGNGPSCGSGTICYVGGPPKDGLCRVGTCDDKGQCVGKYAAETGGYVMMGTGAVGVVAAVCLAVMAVRRA